MSDEISVEGKKYVSSKRASELSAYSQDYIGQLARSGHIDAKRVAGLWYIDMLSLENYKTNPEESQTLVEKGGHINKENNIEQDDADLPISFDGKEYISAKRASQLTGYNQDYVGQLARSGKVLSRQVGNRWYMDQYAILAHKTEKDALLATVQSHAVGIRLPQSKKDIPQILKNPDLLSYKNDTGDLHPLIQGKQQQNIQSQSIYSHDAFYQIGQLQNEHQNSASSIKSTLEKNILPIKVIRDTLTSQKMPIIYVPEQVPTKFWVPTTTTFALTIVIILSFGFVSFKDKSIFANNIETNRLSMTSAIVSVYTSNFLNRIVETVEKWIAPELNYQRPSDK